MKLIILLTAVVMLNIIVNSQEKPNSQVNNPAVYNNVMLDTGELVWPETDIRIAGRGMDFVFQRTYRSQIIYSGVLGMGWDHNYNKRMVELYSGDIIYYDGSGRRERFQAEKKGNTIIGYKAPTGWFVELKKSKDGLFYLIYPDRSVECFNSVGLLTKIIDSNQNKLEFLYDISNQLTGVIDTMGRLIRLGYYPFEKETDEDGVPEGRFRAISGRLKTITDFSGRALTFEYYENGDLKSVDFEGRKKQYTYSQSNNPILAHNLETIKDPKGQIALSVTYSGDKVTELNIGGSKLQYIIGEILAFVTDSMNNQKKFILQDGHISSITEGGYTTSFTYTEDGLIETVTYSELNTVTYGYQGGENRLSAGNLTSISENPGPRGHGDCPLNPTLFNYNKWYNQVTSITYPNGLKVMNSNPDVNGNFQTVTTEGTGEPGFTYTYKYKYNDYGQIESETDAFGMTTSYKYYPELVPGGDETSEAVRKLDFKTGGYLQERSSGLITENFKKYDLRGNLLEYSDSHGFSGIYTYTSFDELHTEDRKADFSLSQLMYKGVYGYDTNGNLKSMKTTYGNEGNQLSSSYTYTYTSRNMLWTETDMGRGITTTYTYDNNDNLECISKGPDTITFTYNNRDLVASIRLGSAPVASVFTYDGNGNIVTGIDPYGHATTNEYDGYDRLRTITDPLNNKTVITRLNFGNTLNIRQMDAAEKLLRESVRVNDPLGRLQSYTMKIPGGTDEVYNYSYQDNGKTLVVTDSLKRTWITKKNDLGQVYYEQDPAGNYTNYYYEDGRGNLTKKVESEIDPEGKIKTYTTEYTYNAFNKVEKIKEWLEGDESTPPVITTFTYDAGGNLTGSKDGEKNVVSHKYDSFGRKEWTEQYLDNGTKIKTSYEYYPNNLLWKIIDHNGNTTEYKYDDQKRLKKVIYPDTTTLEYTYTEKIEDDKKYNMIIEKQRNETVVTTIFDEMNRVKTRSIEPGPGVEGVTLESYGYDGLSRLIHAENDYSTVDMKYDPLNRLIEEKQNGKVVAYSYGVENNLRKMTMTYPNQRIIEKDFDILDRLSNIKQVQENIANYSYIGRSYRLLSQQFGNGDTVSYLYDQARCLITKEAKNKNSDLVNKYIFGYNLVHMKTYEQRGHDSNKGDIFAYDDIYRLIGVKFNSPDPTNPVSEQFEKQKTITFDKLSNILSIAEDINGQTQTITMDIPADSNYSKLNQYKRFDQWGLSYDLNGNTTQKGTQHYGYDYKNRIVSATDANSTVKFKYDALGRRIQKHVTVGSQSKTTNFYYSGNQVIEERDGSDQVTRQFIYGNSIDEVIRIDKYSGTTSTPYYFHMNSIGSTTAVTDANGNIIERMDYDIYGLPTFKDAAGNVIPKSSISNNILFHGREYDPELNLYYFRARYYDPIMGRFLQTDPIGYQDSMNLYQGFNMNPVNFLDPFGERIKFTGDAKERDFEIFKTIFKRIGIHSIDSLIELDEEGYVILKKGKGSLIQYGKKVGRNLKRRDEGGYEAWIKYGTKNLKNYSNFYKMSLEALFEEIINDPRTIEFQINPEKFKEVAFLRNKIGLGVFLHREDPLNFSKDSRNMIVTTGQGGKTYRLYMDKYTTIVHEFGHAFALFKGFYSLDHESLFSELAVMFENLYRLRSGHAYEEILLRAHHKTEHQSTLSNFFFKILKGGKWQIYGPKGRIK